MSRPFWKTYGTMDEFIKALLLRMKEIGISQDLVADATGTRNLGSGSVYWNSAYIQWLTAKGLSISTAFLKLANIATKTTTYTAVANDLILLVDTSGGAWTLTLPAAAGVAGQILIIKKTDAAANALTIDGNGAETIDGAATNAEIDAQYDMLWLLCDGTEWHIIGRWIH